MRAGRLNRSVAIQGYTETQDSFGQVQRVYTTRDTVRAEVRPMNETESPAGGKYDGRTGYKITMRYTTITKKDRLIYDGETLEIAEVVDPSMRRRELNIKAYSDD